MNKVMSPQELQSVTPQESRQSLAVERLHQLLLEARWKSSRLGCYLS